MFTVKKIILFPKHFLNKIISLNGWIKYNRPGKEVGFLVVVDGSGLNGVQVVYKKNLINFQEISKLLSGSAISLQGLGSKNADSAEAIEIIAQSIKIINTTKLNYFLQNKKHSNEFLRSRSDLRARSNLFHSVFRIRSNLSKAVADFFAEEGFVLLNAPMITQNDCEGAGESFVVADNTGEKNFFNKEAILSVSGQLHAEAFAQCYQKVYTFGPTFRAEKSNTKIHTAEFWMVEPEVAFADKKKGILLATKMLKNILQKVYVDSQTELKFLSSFSHIDLLKRIEDLVHYDFNQLSYSQAIKILSQQEQFAQDNIIWGQDLTKEQEIFLCSYFQSQPVFIIDYPQVNKPFYMKKNSDNKTVACFDLLFPQVGEIIGGSQREDDYDQLMQNIRDKKIPVENIEWYLNLRLQGYSGSTGFGLGFDRLLMYITGFNNIRDVIPFFSGYKILKF